MWQSLCFSVYQVHVSSTATIVALTELKANLTARLHLEGREKSSLLQARAKNEPLGLTPLSSSSTISDSEVEMTKMKLIWACTCAATLGLALTGCKSNPHKAEKIETEIKNHGEVTGDTSVGIKDGNMVVQKKVAMNEELRRLQIEVYELEDKVYGNRKYGSNGLYGVLRECKSQLSDTKNGGDGKMKWTEPMDRITDKEDDFKIGLDEKEKLVGVSEEYLKDRLDRFKGYKNVLMKRQDEYEEKVAICKTDLRSQISAKKD